MRITVAAAVMLLGWSCIPEPSMTGAELRRRHMEGAACRMDRSCTPEDPEWYGIACIDPDAPECPLSDRDDDQ